jgi:hypothetical protein
MTEIHADSPKEESPSVPDNSSTPRNSRALKGADRDHGSP